MLTVVAGGRPSTKISCSTCSSSAGPSTATSSRSSGLPRSSSRLPPSKPSPLSLSIPPYLAQPLAQHLWIPRHRSLDTTPHDDSISGHPRSLAPAPPRPPHPLHAPFLPLTGRSDSLSILLKARYYRLRLPTAQHPRDSLHARPLRRTRERHESTPGRSHFPHLLRSIPPVHLALRDEPSRGESRACEGFGDARRSGA